MLGLGGNISASAPVGASGATQPPSEQLVFTYNLEEATGLNATVTTGETIGGYTGLLKAKDTSTNIYFGVRLSESFEYLPGDIIRVEYYIPSTNIDVNSFDRIFIGTNIDNQNASDVTDQLISDDLVYNGSGISSSYGIVYFTTYNSGVQSSDTITNDLAYLKSVKVYRES